MHTGGRGSSALIRHELETNSGELTSIVDPLGNTSDLYEVVLPRGN
jgi:hypothetical protein